MLKNTFDEKESQAHVAFQIRIHLIIYYFEIQIPYDRIMHKNKTLSGYTILMGCSIF